MHGPCGNPPGTGSGADPPTPVNTRRFNERDRYNLRLYSHIVPKRTEHNQIVLCLYKDKIQLSQYARCARNKMKYVVVVVVVVDHLLSFLLPVVSVRGRLYHFTLGTGIPETLQTTLTVSPSLVIISPALPSSFSFNICGGTVMRI